MFLARNVGDESGRVAMLLEAGPAPRFGLVGIDREGLVIAAAGMGDMIGAAAQRTPPPGIPDFDGQGRVGIFRLSIFRKSPSADSTPANIVRAIREHAFSYFSKPFSPSAVADIIAQAVNTGHWQDDIEVLSASPQWISLRLRCKMETADRLMQFVREMEMEFPPRERDNIAAAFRELLMNAIEHGGGSDPNKRVQVTYVRTTRAIIYVIQDPGKGFSFDAITHAAIANPPDEPAKHLEIRAEQGVRPGGFGILLTRNLVDELIYNEKGNEVLFIKYLK